MSDQRLRWKLNGHAQQAMAIAEAIALAPVGYVVEIRPETRSDAQNRLMWPLLTDVSNQAMHFGRQLPPGEWKNGFVMALDNAEFIPGIQPGTIWPLGLSTSIFGKAKFSDLIEVIYAYGAEHEVRFRTDIGLTRSLIGELK